MRKKNGIEIRSENYRSKEKFSFLVKNYPIENLIPHEEIVEERLQDLIDNIKKTGILNIPVIITTNYVILDGHHRYYALKKIGTKYVPAIKVDYKDDKLVTVDTWYPLISESLETITNSFAKSNFAIEEVKEENVETILQKREAVIFACSDKKVKISGERDKIFEMLNEYTSKTKYIDKRKTALKLAKGNNTAIISWAYTKEEIIDRAKRGRRFTPKTTLHSLKYQYTDSKTKLKELM